MATHFTPELFIFEPETDKSLEVTAQYGPRAVARALGQVFNTDAEWDERLMGKVANLIADYTSGERQVADELRRELRNANLHVTFMPL
jgi:hypothetical protein